MLNRPVRSQIWMRQKIIFANFSVELCGFSVLLRVTIFITRRYAEEAQRTTEILSDNTLADWRRSRMMFPPNFRIENRERRSPQRRQSGIGNVESVDKIQPDECLGFIVVKIFMNFNRVLRT